RPALARPVTGRIIDDAIAKTTLDAEAARSVPEGKVFQIAAQLCGGVLDLAVQQAMGQPLARLQIDRVGHVAMDAVERGAMEHATNVGQPGRARTTFLPASTPLQVHVLIDDMCIVKAHAQPPFRILMQTAPRLDAIEYQLLPENPRRLQR